MIKYIFSVLLIFTSPLTAGDKVMTAKGSFEVTLTPQSDEVDAGRMTIDKTFSGDLTGTSKGQMLSHRSAVAGSAGYVAIEHVTGKLGDRSGSFTLQHNATMAGGEQSQTITVVPDSGAGGFAGITGSMDIEIKDGDHYYEFTYTFE